MKHSRGTVEIFGAPLDLGANIRGANIGPSAIRIAGLKQKLSVLGYQVIDHGDVAVPVRESLSAAEEAAKYIGTVTDVCATLYETTMEALGRGHFPLVVGGDHSLAIGTVSGVSEFYHLQDGAKIGMIWIDAHADLNTPQTSPSGNIHGMPLAVLLGQGFDQLKHIGGNRRKVDPKNVALIGIRTLDHEEKETVRKSGVCYYTMREIDERGMAAVMKDAIAVATNGTAAVHLSFDIDAIDPLYAPGVSTPVTGGLSYREAHLALEMIADTRKLCSAEFVEINPITDQDHKTALLAVELAQSALGKSIV